MFRLYNPTPREVFIDHDGKRITIPPGETKGIWDTGGYVGPEDAQYVTSDKKWGRVGLVLWGEKETHAEARQRGLKKFVEHVERTVRDWYAMNTELAAKRKPTHPIYQQRGLEELIDLAEQVSNDRNYKGRKLLKADVIARYNAIAGIPTVQHIGGDGNGNGDNTKMLDMLTQMQAQMSEMSERQQLLEDENDALRAKLAKNASPVPSLEEAEELPATT